MRELTRITAIGSCRIATPFKTAADFYPVVNNNNRIYGYTHTSGEALQQLKFLHGEFTPNHHLLPFLMPNSDLNALGAEEHKISDYYFVELSSAKSLRIGDTHVQLNYLASHFKDFFADKTRAGRYWRLSNGENQHDKLEFLKAQDSYQTLESSDQELLAELTLHATNLDAISQDLRDLRSRVPRLVVVTHCNASAQNGSPLPSRSAYIELVEQAARDEGVEVFNPTVSMLAFGQREALSDPDTSLSHYSEEFGEFMFDGLFEKHIAKLHQTGAMISSSSAVAKAIALFENRTTIKSISPHIGGVAMITGSLGAGGAERQLTRIAVEMKKLQSLAAGQTTGITGEVEVIVSNLSSESGRDFFLPVLTDAGITTSVIGDLPADPVVSGLDPELEKLLPFIPRQSMDSVRRLTPHLQSSRPEVVYIWQDGAVLSNAIAALIAGVPRIVVSLRGMPPDMRPSIMRNEYFEMYCALAKIPGVTISANTHVGARAYENWLKLEHGFIKTLHNAVEPISTDGGDEDVQKWDEFTLRTSNADFTFGGVFRFTENKRPYMWLEFAAAAQVAYPNSRFIMVGDGVEFEAAKSYAAELGIKDRCLFTGKSRNVGYWMSKFDTLGLLSRLEGLPNVLIEAQLAGIPVISTPAGGAAEAFIHGQTGMLLGSAEEPQLAEFLRHFLTLANDKPRCKSMGKLAKKFARNEFAMQHILPQTLQLLSGRPEVETILPEVEFA